MMSNNKKYLILKSLKEWSYKASAKSGQATSPEWKTPTFQNDFCMANLKKGGAHKVDKEIALGTVSKLL